MPKPTPPSPQGLYAITPDCLETRDLLSAVAAALAGGCRWIQYRNKRAAPALRREQAGRLNDLCRDQGANLIINDDMNLAREISAAGVHLGREDGDIAHARQFLGSKAILGASCYQEIDMARTAIREGANYVAFGAVYPSPTKPLATRAPLFLLRRAKMEGLAPVCAIGGITLANAAPLIKAGVDLLAVISDLFSPPCDPAFITARAAAYQRLFKDTP
jgi:thiamine-phosphate pyrophosphorylase